MELISRKGILWDYLSEEIKGLIYDGEILLDHGKTYEGEISDFSYLVFPFSKAYEGFLKKLFLDLDLIREDEYYGDDIRIGRVLNPGYIQEHSSVYRMLTERDKGGQAFSTRLWNVWKKGRNQVFHYFPHNFRRLSYTEALAIIDDIVGAMNLAIEKCNKSFYPNKNAKITTLVKTE